MGDAQEALHYYAGTRRYATGASGLTAVAVSRVLLEWTIRRRVAANPGVVFYDRSSVLDLVFSEDGRRVTGLVVSSVDRPGSPRRLEADLVVDASGRTSRTPEWLERRGFQPPEEERVRCDISYATRRFRRRPGDAGTALAILQPATAAVPRSGVLIAQENDEWIAGVTGYHGVRPPTELSDFLAYAADARVAGAGHLLEKLEPLDDGCTYRFQASVRRRYERLSTSRRDPRHRGRALLLRPGFRPGNEYRGARGRRATDGLTEGREDLGRRFFHRAAQHIDTPWQIVVGGMPPAPGTTVRKPMSADWSAPTSTPCGPPPSTTRSWPARFCGSPTWCAAAEPDDAGLARVLGGSCSTGPPWPVRPPCRPARTGWPRRHLSPAPRAAVRPTEPAAPPSTQPPGRRGPVHHRTGHVS